MTELDALQWHSFRNDANSTATAYGILRVTGINTTEGLTSITVDKPSNTTTAYAVNGPVDVSANSYGQCVLFGPCVFAYDTGTPAFNDFYSAKDAQWTANKTGNFIRCLGIIDSTNKFALGIIGSSNPSVRFYTGTTTAAVTSSNSTFTVSGLTARDGGSVPAADSGSNWTVQNSANTGDAYAIDTSKVIKIIGYSDGTLHTIDAPCPA